MSLDSVHIQENLANLNLLFNFLINEKQKLVLNDQASSLTDVNAWVPQGFTFDALLFLIYINDFADDFLNPKLFADDTSLFSVTRNVNTSADEVNTLNILI